MLPTGDDSHVSHAQRVDAVVLRRRVWYCPKQNKSSHELLRLSAAVHTFISLLVFPPVLRFLGSRDHWKLCSIHGEPSVEHSLASFDSTRAVHGFLGLITTLQLFFQPFPCLSWLIVVKVHCPRFLFVYFLVLGVRRPNAKRPFTPCCCGG